MHACVLSRVWLTVTLWTVAQQAPLSMAFSRQEYWTRLPSLLPGDLPDSGIEPTSAAVPASQADSLLPSYWRIPLLCSSVQFSRSVVSDSLQSHGLQHSRPPCPSTPGVYSNSSPLSWWCHPTISSFVVPFSSCLQSFPGSGSFPMNQFFASGGQSIGVSASTSVLPMNTQDLFPLGWTGWISLQFKGLSKVFSNTTVQKHQFSALISMAKKLSTKQLKLIFLSELVCFYPTPLRSLFPRHSGPSLKPLSTFFPFHSHFVAQLKHFVSVVHAIAVMKLTPFPPCFSLLRHHHSLHTTRRSSKIWLWLCFFSYSVTFRMALH